MSSTITVKSEQLSGIKSENRKVNVFSKIGKSASLILIAAMFIAGSILSPYIN